MSESVLNPLVEGLRQRAALLRRVRSFFDGRGFLEVQPPCLSRDCVIDNYLDPIEVDVGQLGLPRENLRGWDGRVPEQYFLQTSPESAMKRLLAMGAPSIYAITPVFRRGESGHRHNVEFTMLEWYEVGGNAASAISILSTLARETFGTPQCEVVSYRQLFHRELGFDPLDVSLTLLVQHVEHLDAVLAESMIDDRDALLDVLLSQLIEPKLAFDHPVIISRYPLTQAALARPCPDDPQCAERFELFYRGVELANGYDELSDADELHRRFVASNRIRQARGAAPLPVETTLLDAMRRGIPRCAGVAVGLDRLLMLGMKSTNIKDVIPLPIDVA